MSNDHEKDYEKYQEMIFSQDSIEKIHELGSGEYGSVFKGNLVHGKAVYVNFALNYYFTRVRDITIYYFCAMYFYIDISQ